MDLPPALLAAFPASSDLLLDIASRQVDDGMLREIAAADYGCDVDAHLAGLRPIRDQGIVPAPMGWHPGEVLELIRWSNPENPAHKPGSPGRRGHQMRAFACAALLRAALQDGGDITPEATLAQCLASAKVLGEEMSGAAARFLTWVIPLMPRSEFRWLFAFGLLAVATRLRSGRVADRALGDAAHWVLAEEASGRAPIDPSNPQPLAFGLLYGYWRPLAAELLREAADIHADDVRDNLGFIGAFVLDPD
jgi:hypothetical protein